jgi:RNA polymerase sigma-70 factor (ECF subfamily)
MRRAYCGALGLVGNHDDALDLSQEAFVRAFGARGIIDPDRPFYPWLYQIIRRLCFNHTRNHKTRAEILRAATPWLVQQVTDKAEAGKPDIRVERRELRQLIESGLAKLSDAEREVLVLKEFEGLRYKAIAELLDIPIGTVMSRLYAARRKMAALLEGTP